MRLSWRGWFRIVLLAVAGALVWVRLVPHHRSAPARGIPDRSARSPLNQQGGGPAPADAYEVYSALYQTPMQEPLVFSEESVTDVPQVGGSCLKPSTPDQRAMVDAFTAANRQSHTWQKQFAIPAGYRMLTRQQAGQAQTCLETHGRDAARCNEYRDVRHVRFLGVPGFDPPHTHALVSVIRMCGSFCGAGGIFEVEKTASAWQRAETSDFTRDCSWMY
jgi:uncharacterized protein YbdZ (MbtH family)